MTKNEKQDLESLKIGFENTEWKDFLLVLNEIRNRDKEIIAMYRKSHIELKDLKKALAKEEKANTHKPLNKQEPKALIIDGVSKSLNADELINSLGTPDVENEYIVKPDTDGTWWMEHKHVGSGEPLKQWLTGKP